MTKDADYDTKTSFIGKTYAVEEKKHAQTKADCPSFRIVVKNPQDGYLAGSTIIGVVEMEVPKDISCRGVCVGFYSQAYCYFKHQSHHLPGHGNKDRVFTVTGSKASGHVGQNWKNYARDKHCAKAIVHRTDIIRGGGQNPNFTTLGKNDGILRIPYELNPGTRVVIRLLDHQYGKSDDLLGELVLDVTGIGKQFPEFHPDSDEDFVVELKDQPLFRNGKPEAGYLTLSLSWEDEFLDRVRMSRNGKDGEMELYEHEEGRTLRINLLSAKGLLQGVHNRVTNDVYAQGYILSEQMVATAFDSIDGLLKEALPVPHDQLVLKSGSYAIPFKIEIPKHTPSTNYYKSSDDIANLNNSLRAWLDIGWKQDISHRQPINVWQFIPTYVPRYLKPLDCHVGVNVNCCFSRGGQMSGRIALDRCAYAVGETIFVTMSIYTGSLKHPMKVNITLDRFIRLQGAPHNQSVVERDSIQDAQDGCGCPDIKPGQPYHHIFELKVPPTAPSFHGTSVRKNETMSAYANSDDPFRWYYEVVVDVLPATSTPFLQSMGFTKFLPICVGSHGVVKHEKFDDDYTWAIDESHAEDIIVESFPVSGDKPPFRVKGDTKCRDPMSSDLHSMIGSSSHGDKPHSRKIPDPTMICHLTDSVTCKDYSIQGEDVHPASEVGSLTPCFLQSWPLAVPFDAVKWHNGEYPIVTEKTIWEKSVRQESNDKQRSQHFKTYYRASSTNVVESTLPAKWKSTRVSNGNGSTVIHEGDV